MERNEHVLRIVLALLITCGFVAVVICLVLAIKNETNHDLLSMMAGQLSMAFAAVVREFFKKRKD